MEDSMFEMHEAVENRHWWFVARARIISQVLRQFIRDDDERLIVDVGCGTGGMVNFLANDFQCLGIYHSDTAISKATALYPGRLFKCGDVHSHISALKNETSVFLLMDVLEHIEDDRTFMENLIGALPAGGKILITVPAKKVLWSQHDLSAHHFRRYEMGEFKGLWAGLNVKSVGVSYFNSRLYPLIWVARFLGNLMNLTWGKDKTDFSLPPRFINWLLTAIFAGEAKRILRIMNDQDSKPYAIGVSLIAVLEKTGDTSSSV